MIKTPATGRVRADEGIDNDGSKLTGRTECCQENTLCRRADLQADSKAVDGWTDSWTDASVSEQGRKQREAASDWVWQKLQV